MQSRRIAALLLTLAAIAAPETVAANFSDIWWNPSESGWGVTIADHETNFFAVLYHYGANGKPAWWVIPGGTFSQDGRIFQGDVYATSGPPYTNATFDPASVTVSKVGSASFDLAPSGLAADTILLSYTIGSVSRTRQLQRQPFGDAAPSWGTDWTDLWYDSAESGWGLSVSQHGNNAFAVWYTYDADRSPTWFVIPGGTFSSGGFAGAVYQTTGPGIDADAFDPAKVVVTGVGNATFALGGTASAAGGKSGGDFTPCIHGSCFPKPVARQPFGNMAPAPVAGTCSGTYNATIVCPGDSFTSNGSFRTDGVNYERSGAFQGFVSIAHVPTLDSGPSLDHPCALHGYEDEERIPFNGAMDLSRTGHADFAVWGGTMPVHADLTLGTSTVLGVMTSRVELPGFAITMNGRFSCTH